MANSRYIPSYVPSTTNRRNYGVLGSYPPPGASYYQQPNNQYGNNPKPDDGLNLTISVHPGNEYNDMVNYGPSQHQMSNRGLTYATKGQKKLPPPPDHKRRVKIIDHNHHTPTTMASDYAPGRQSHNSTHENSHSRQNHTSELNRSQPKSKPSVPNQHSDEYRLPGYTGNNFNIHDYIYGPGDPDLGRNFIY
jgi:hypothetical protein